MLIGQHLLSGKGKYLTGALLLLFIVLSCAAFSIADDDDFEHDRREVLLRRIGHEVLLQSGDSTSSVLPIKTIAKNEYQISFEHTFTFQADSLVKITQRLLAKDPLATDYVVNVLHTGKLGVAYAYAISKNKKDDIISCIGRKQPIAPYRIGIKFKPRGITPATKGYLLGCLPLLAFVGLIFLRSSKPPSLLPAGQPADTLTLGAMLFDPPQRKLLLNGSTLTLTGTETRILHVFALCPNQVIERSRLQKEIWEDEGVIVGRSLDMFISKLRKKLEADPTVKIVVIRGKGYRLEIRA